MKKIILGIMVLLNLASANAISTLIEPMVTYENGDGTIERSAGNNGGGVNGFGVGARVAAMVLETVFLGVDGRYSRPQFESPDLNMSADTKAWNLGPVLGVQLPLPFKVRAWGGWVANGQLDPELSNGYDFKFKRANGYRVGAGVGFTIVSFNLEYQDIDYKRAEVNASPAGTNWDGLRFNNQSAVLSVSFPLSL